MSETPILVGAAQLEQRIDDPATAREPIELMIDAVRLAAEDAGAPGLLEKAASVRVIRGIWSYQNPARAVAEAVGCPAAETALTPYGGNFVQTVVNQSALDIQRGDRDIVVITGAECGNTQAKARRAGLELDWQALPGTPDRMFGEDKDMSHEAEKALRIRAPIQIYPMFENALRYHRGESIDAHLKRISELWAGFSRVAAGNPHAWLREPRSAEEIRTISAQNRPVSFPYPKLMNSNNNVDQGAALIMCSERRARELGIPEDKWIYPWAGTDAHDHYFVSNREDFHSSPAIRIAGRRVLELTGLTPADLDLVDVYSCFPVAVQIAAAEIGLDTSRDLTITGGLTFAGGPLNNYVMHSIARAVELLREQRGAKALITANGGYLTKHAFGVYSTTPPAQPFQHQDVQAEVDATPSREVALDYRGDATVETYTVMYGPEGPAIGHVVCRLPDGRRAWANCEDADVLQAMTREEFCGRPVKVADHRASF
ncbi:MAG: acetyl-CoA acetyltransferase [Gammaproteobacteria bacterium]|nr:acetyl-CoA acetyltransferase [Gammaproteobacteria bacterium]|tara:strand:- start:2179 stop:3636 length:1458 start_codon:yes stop_codon:yes gene_type:complete